MKKHINTFSTGINQDISTNKYPNTSFYWAQNFRLVSKDGLATGALTNIDGTLPKLGLGGGHTIIGHCLIRDTLIMFVSSEEGGKIVKWEYSNNDFEESPTVIYYHPDLDFNINRPVRAIGRYETESIQKIYFTDGETFFKFLNIIPGEGESYPLNNYRTLESLDLVSDADFSNINLELVTGGNLKAGKIQYTYQLYSKRGSESMFSPASKLIHLTNSDETRDTYEYEGSEVGDVINKSVIVTIDDVDPYDKELFTRLRLVALEYTVYDQIPTVRVVGEYNIENKSTLTVTDNGTSIGELTLEEFRFIQNDFFPKTLDIKDDHLFAANIKNNYFTIDDNEFDARTFRFNNSGQCYVWNGNNAIPVSSNWSDLPDVTDETFNKFNDWTNDYTGDNGTNTNYQYKYRTDGITLGGDGPYISYEFTTNRVLLDDAAKQQTGWQGGLPKQVINNSENTNNTNPLTNIGYKRDEVYRFGIVFFDSKGRQSFVKWIGDIRFPSNKEIPYIYYNNSEPTKVYADILGIKFDVNLPSELKEKITGYQIVRAQRTASDKTIITQSVLSYMKDGGVLGHGNQVLDEAMYSHATPTYTGECVAGQTLIYEASELISELTTDDGDKILGSYNRYYRGPNQTLRGDYLDLVSPEIVFNKPKLSESNAYIELEGYLDTPSKTAVCGPKYSSDDNTFVVSDKYRKYTGYPTYKQRKAVDFAKIYKPQLRNNPSGNYNLDASNHVLPEGVRFNNQCQTGNIDGHNNLGWAGARGTFALVRPEEEFSLDTNWGGSTSTRIFLANYKVDKGRSIYGGSTYENRVNTTYYPASSFVDKNFDSSFTPGSVTTQPMIQIINALTGNLVEEGNTIKITTAKYFEFFVSNYGTSDLTVSSVTLSALSDWTIVNDPSGVIVPGDTAYGRISYTGAEAGMSYCAVNINSDADNDSQVVFTLGVDYINGGDGGGSNNPPNEQMSTSSIEDTTGLRVFNGDTFINYMWYLRSMWDDSYKKNDIVRISDNIIEVIQMIPFESSINIDLRLDRPEDYMNWGYPRGGESPNYKLMENINDGISIFGKDYPMDVGNLYRYNSAYSAIDKSKEFYPEPFDFEQTVTYDTRIVVSEKKFNGEYIDNWTKFKFNNYLDVDSKHNAITKILTFKNNLFYFQATAVGVASVNQRSLIQDNQPGQLALGTGGILTRYDYITDKSGSEYYEGILASDDYMFYADGRRKRVNKIVPGKEVAVSVVKGIDSTLDKLPWEKVRAGFDRGYNEVIFAIDDKTLAFNETADAFTSSYTFNPGLMFSINNSFFSVAESQSESPWLYSDLETSFVAYSDNVDEDYIIIGPETTGETLYKHNAGDPGVFYGGDGTGQDSYITLIINPEGNNVCFFDNLDLRTESTLNNTDDPDDIFYKLEASNNYQSITRDLAFLMDETDPNTGYKYHAGSIKRIGRVWRTPIMATPPSGSSYSRMVDTYLKVTLRYSNTGNKFRVHDIVTYYRPSKH